jgi:hypothetical protein
MPPAFLDSVAAHIHPAELARMIESAAIRAK